MIIKNKIKVFRAERNMTQQDLAIKCGVTRQTIIAIERGKYVPSLALAFKIAKTFKVGVGEVFNEN